jgi:hypothetical protein
MISARTFAFGFGLTLTLAVIFNALSLFRAWVAPGCADCVVAAGVPFPFVSHGGFFTRTVVLWRGVRDDVVVIVALAALAGLVSARVTRP